MGDTGHRPTPPALSPRLARKYYNVDDSSSNDDGSDDDTSDSESLVILSPIRNKMLGPSRNTMGTDCKIRCENNADKKAVTNKKAPPVDAMSVSKPSTKTKTVSTDDKKNTNFSISSDSETDEDDAFLLRSKQVFERQKCPRPSVREKQNEDLKERKKREREAQKEIEKQHRMQKRKKEREERERRKLEEKRAKKKQSEELNQAMGKYSHEEIAVLLDSDLYRDDPHGLVEALSADFFVHPYQNMLIEEPSSAVALIQFIRRDKVLGGAKEAVERLESKNERGNISREDEQGFEHIQYLAVLFQPDDFIPLLYRDVQEEDDDYPALECWLDCLRSRWKRVWSSATTEPKIIFLLAGLPEALDKKWIEYRRNNGNASRSNTSLPTVKELQDAMQWILVQFQVECILCPNNEFLQSSLHKLTRGLADRPYINQVTELECIKKIKQGFVDSSDTLEKAKDVWLRQLQQLPGISETKAQYITEHFPTCQSLWQAYQWEHLRQQEENQTKNSADRVCFSLLEDKFSADNKRYKKLSELLYRVLTSNDPFEMIL